MCCFTAPRRGASYGATPSPPLAAAGFHVIALDLPPFGFSDRPGSYTRQDQAARVNDVLIHLKAAPAIIVGHSFGAGAATELVMRYPDRARALVLVDAALGLTAAPSDAPWIIQPKWIREVLVSLTITNPVATQALLEFLIAKKERALPEFVAILQRPTTQRDSTPDIADWLHYFLGTDRNAVSADRDAYARTKLPTAILWGNQDTITPIDQAADLLTLLPQASLTVLPGLGHIPQIEDPGLVQRRPAQVAWQPLNSAQIRPRPETSWISSDCAPGVTPPCSAS